MNGIDAPARMRVADNEKAEAKKILQIKRAEGDAESNISGLGVASSARSLLTGSEIVCSHSLKLENKEILNNVVCIIDCKAYNLYMKSVLPIPIK
ncbi:hypothetical protein DKX38_015445 [Salix brachista]|uniref:Uncharacterized protein n=1 Tax=Salix brachista TaxID=2182728 RepID=A0A5N5L5F2_9ROSI|nr:hypothetical protein DKX38_015445 [Salix brachista]